MSEPGYPLPNRQRPDICTAVHAARMRTGDWSPGDGDQLLGVLITRSGTRQYRSWCRQCSTRSGSIPHWIVEGRWADYGRHPTWRIDESAESARCAYVGCGLPAEWHHIAPRNTFGQVAEHWPLVPLCPSHHREWHERMDGYRWKTRAS